MRPQYRSVILNKIAISPMGKYAYINAPKCACSTIRRTLLEIERIEKRLGNMDESTKSSIIHHKHYPLSFNQIEGKEVKLDDYYVFAVVRNPYTRILSAYLDKFENDRGLPETRVFEKRYDVRASEISFKDFLKIIKGERSENLDPHWQPMTSILGVGLLLYDYIGKLESMDVFFDEVLKKLSRSLASFVEWNVHRTDSNRKIRKYYDKVTVELVNEIYHDDFKCFSYPMNDLENLSGWPVDCEKLNNRSNAFFREYVFTITKYQDDWKILAEKLSEIGGKYNQAYCLVESGNLFFNNGESERAESAYLNAIEIDPELPFPHFQLSRFHQKRNQIEEAIKEIQIAIDLQRENQNFRDQFHLLVNTKEKMNRIDCRKAGNRHNAL